MQQPLQLMFQDEPGPSEALYQPHILEDLKLQRQQQPSTKVRTTKPFRLRKKEQETAAECNGKSDRV